MTQSIGGQAVIEGVMLRSSNYCTVAVRKEGNILTNVMRISPLKCQKIPVLRGILALVDMLLLGIKSLTWSAAQAEGATDISKKEIIILFTTAIIISILGFVLLPLFLTMFIVSSKGVLFSLVDGAIRFGLFIGYLAIIFNMEDVKRLFQYHGAEHKVVNCYEQNQKVSLELAKKCSTIHPRCGTTFVIIIMIIGILFFTLFNPEGLLGKLIVRIVALPLIVGISYEVIKLQKLRFLLVPGLWVQKMTTSEPMDSELEVAVAAINALLDKEA